MAWALRAPVARLIVLDELKVEIIRELQHGESQTSAGHADMRIHPVPPRVVLGDVRSVQRTHAKQFFCAESIGVKRDRASEVRHREGNVVRGKEFGPGRVAHRRSPLDGILSILRLVYITAMRGSGDFIAIAARISPPDPRSGSGGQESAP